ncbi:MAG TPA: hypothetical protein PLL54_05150, partial [Dermatophilaceae bacterium]|nr:hypothetical protein [Dermatophilaceae bacterium]
TDYVAKLTAAGFVDAAVEVTRSYDRTDVEALAMALAPSELPEGLDVEAAVDALVGTFASASVRARKPAGATSQTHSERVGSPRRGNRPSRVVRDAAGMPRAHGALSVRSRRAQRAHARAQLATRSAAGEASPVMARSRRFDTTTAPTTTARHSSAMP